jgi:hypothetical protein
LGQTWPGILFLFTAGSPLHGQRCLKNKKQKKSAKRPSILTMHQPSPWAGCRTSSGSSIATLLKASVFLVCMFMIYVVFSDGLHTGMHVDYKQTIAVAIKGGKGAFIHQSLASEIDGPFDSTAITRLCTNTTWTPGLIMKCEPPSGDVSEVRNAVLICVRYAIEMGGELFLSSRICKGR